MLMMIKPSNNYNLDDGDNFPINSGERPCDMMLN